MNKPKLLWAPLGASEDYQLHEDKNDCIESILEQYNKDEWPNKITIVAFRKADPFLYSRDYPLENMLLVLDENFGDIDGDAYGPTKKMEEAEREFISIVLSEYDPFVCTEIFREDVFVETWIDLNATGWRDDNE